MYFDKFKKATATHGIPDAQMNAPLAPRPVKGDVGIEFEFEATNKLPWDSGQINSTPPCKVTGAYWTAKEDHSLRGGVEYVTTSAVAIESVPEMVNGLYSSIRDYKTNLRLSNRCSTHVHLNVSTWKIDRIVSFYMLWALFEPLLIEWNGPRRKTNHFCLSITDSPASLNALTSYLRTGQWHFGDGHKYSALNLRRIFDLGTLEVRIGDAWPSPERPIMWIKFLDGLRKYTENIYPTELPAKISGDTVLGVLREISELAGVPEFYDEITGMFSIHEAEDLAFGSFREAIHLAYFPWHEWRELIEREYIVNPFGKKKVNVLDPIAAPRLRVGRGDPFLGGMERAAERERAMREAIRNFPVAPDREG
jgi:hypothetical protein